MVNDKVSVKRTGATYAVFVNGSLYEGGFFGRRAAETAAHALREENDVKVADLAHSHLYESRCTICHPELLVKR